MGNKEWDKLDNYFLLSFAAVSAIVAIFLSPRLGPIFATSTIPWLDRIARIVIVFFLCLVVSIPLYFLVTIFFRKDKPPINK